MRTEEVKEATEARERLVATLKARVASTLKAIEEQGGTLPKAVLLRIFEQLEKDLAKHLKAHPMPVITRMDGRPIEEGTPIADLVVPGLIADLPIHPDAIVDTEPRKAG